MPRPRLVSNEHILEIARACFIECGHQAPTTLIAERVGLSQSALFKRFGSKENLFLKAMAPPKTPPWVALFDAGPDERPLYTQFVGLTAIVDGFFEWLIPTLATLHGARINPFVLMNPDEPPPELGRRAILGWVERARAAGRLSEGFDVESFTYAYMGGMASRRFIHKLMARPLTETSEAFAARHVRQLLGGWLPPEEWGDAPLPNQPQPPASSRGDSP